VVVAVLGALAVVLAVPELLGCHDRPGVAPGRTIEA
jgi:hypothetical protein